MNAYTYILYSKALDRFYIGSTEFEPSQRLQLHLNEHYGKSKFTSKSKDWTIFFELKCQSIQQAREIEAHIKRMKSRIYIQNLVQYPVMFQKLLIRYSTTGSSR